MLDKPDMSAGTKKTSPPAPAAAPRDDGVLELDLLNVFSRMGATFKRYIWLMVCFAVAGFCVPLLMYQFEQKADTVSSVVTLDYTVNGEQVADLTAPDETALNLSQVSSAYVLTKALHMTALSKSITVQQLADNLTVERVPSEEQTYMNRFVVRLKNGFGNLTSEELKALLDNIIVAYNAYLNETYSAVGIPEDTLSGVEWDTLDLPVAAEKLSSAVQSLISYCDEKPDWFLRMRLAKDGITVNDLADMLQQISKNSIEPVNDRIVSESFSADAAATLTQFQYKLNKLKLQLEETENAIAANRAAAEGYEKDLLAVTLNESEGNVTVRSANAYYNALFIKRAALLEERSDILIQIADLNDRIKALTGNTADEQTLAETRAELEKAYSLYKQIYTMLQEHAAELADTDEARWLISYTASQGETTSFTAACGKKAAVGAVAGLFIAIVFWGCAALGHEVKRGRNAYMKEAV